MNKKRWLWITAVLLGLSVTGIAAAYLRQEQSHSEKKEQIRVTAVLPHNDYGYWTKAREGILKGGEEYGVDVKIVLPRMNYDIPQMTELIRQETVAKVDALIVQGIEDENYLEALSKAQQQGVLIVFIDTDVENTFEHLYVGTDNYAAGKKMGEMAAVVTDGYGSIAILSGEENYPNLEERYEGILAVLENHPDLKIACIEYNHYDSLRAMDKYHTILQDHPEATTLVCIEGTSGQAFGTRLTAENREFEHILVFDAADETLRGLRLGAFDGILNQQQSEMGRIAVCEIQSRIEKSTRWNYKILTDVDWITKENLEDTLDE